MDDMEEIGRRLSPTANVPETEARRGSQREKSYLFYDSLMGDIIMSTKRHEDTLDLARRAAARLLSQATTPDRETD